MKPSYFETDWLLLAKDPTEKAWFFRIICMALASIAFRYSLKGNLDVLTTT
jgi:hypothetical protein